MKFQKIFRMRMMLVGLGVGLFLANSAYAQQEVDPTMFDSEPAVAQAQSAAVPQQAPSYAVVEAAQAEAAAPAEMNNDLAAIQEANPSRWTEVETLAMLATVLCLGSLVAYGIAETQRKRDSQLPA